MSFRQKMCLEVLYCFVRMFPLSVRMHHNDTSLPDKPLQSAFNLVRRKRGIRIAGHDIPENKLKAEGSGHVDGVVIELPVGRSKQGRVMMVFGFEQTNRPKDFLFLLLRRMERHMRMDFPVGADFKEWNLKESLHLPIMFCDPPSRHKESGGDLLLYQIVDQRLIIARSVTHRAEVERQRNSWTGGRAGLNHLGLRNGRRSRHEHHRKDQTPYARRVGCSHAASIPYSGGSVKMVTACQSLGTLCAWVRNR